MHADCKQNPLIRRRSKRPGYALMLVLVFVVLFTAILGVAWRRVASALRVEHLSEVRRQCDQGGLQVLADAMKMLETCLRLDTSTGNARLPDSPLPRRIQRGSRHGRRCKILHHHLRPQKRRCHGKKLDGECQECGVSRGTRLTRVLVFAAGESQFLGGKKGTGPICAKHPPGRSGKLDLSPFSPPEPPCNP